MSQEAKHFDFLQGFREHQGAKGGFNLLRDEIPEGLKRVPGIYIIETTNRFKFPYPGGKSSILYIGMSKDLDQRFREHRSAVQKIHNDLDYGIEDFVVVNTKYQYMARHGARVYYYACRGAQDPKSMESWALWNFYSVYRAQPVGNGARSFDVEPKED